MDAVAIESVPAAANQSVDAVAIESVPAQEAGNVSTPRVDMSAVATAALNKVQSAKGKGQKSKKLLQQEPTESASWGCNR